MALTILPTRLARLGDLREPRAALVGKAAFTPVDLPGLKLWLDASNGVVTGIASYVLTGTVAQTGNTLTGVLTAFLAEVTVGDNISGGGVNGNVTAIASNTSLTLDRSATVGAGDTVTLTPVAGVTDRVSQWTDLSGLGNHAVQATQSKQPDLKRSIVNGRNVVRFDGVDDVLLLSGTGLNIAKNVTGLTMIAVSQATLPGTERVTVSFLNNGAGGRAALLRESSAAGKFNVVGRRLDADSIQKLAGTGIVASVFDIQSGVFDYSNALGSGFINGATSIAPATFQTAGSTSNTASSAASIGAASDGTGCIAGDIAELIVCNVALNSSALLNTNRYLSAKYGIQTA